MKNRKKYLIILAMVFGYIILQFLAWEIMFVRKAQENLALKEKLAALSSTDDNVIRSEIDSLRRKKNMQVFMIVSEGTVFLLLLLVGVSRIKKALDRERELNDQQQNFFLSITHELKTPIAANRLHLQTLLKHKLNEDQAKKIVESSLQENERLNELIDNLLLANRVGAGKIQLHKESVNAGKITEQILSRYYSREIEKGILRLKIAGEIYLQLDTLAYTSILTNLVNNAMKYSFDHVQVDVSLSKIGREAILSVCDQGCGIPEEEKKKIFDRFYRAGSEETRRGKGTGLGLYIAGHLAKEHGGEIKVKDHQPKGSNFEVIFKA